MCCVCKSPHGVYKGKHVCGDEKCKVPVIVCDGCKRRADGELKKQLRCPLCERVWIGLEKKGIPCVTPRL